MVALTKIYTRTGDDGSTGLVGQERRGKDHPRIEAIGAVDEANAAIGLARLATARSSLDDLLVRIQNDLFDLGADLATIAQGEDTSTAVLRVSAAQVTRLEQEIDALNAELEPLRSFVLPGGTPAAAALHQARTATRRAERRVVELSRIDGETVSGPLVAYLNRLSDLLFVAARTANDGGRSDVLWVPGKHR